jgi:hypothetical protein
MALHYPVVAPFLASLGILIPRGTHVRDLHLLQIPAAIAPEMAPAFTLLCCWHVWKQRNAALL